MKKDITPNRIFTRRQVVSLFLPYSLYYTKASSFYDKKLEEVMSYTEEEKLVVFKTYDTIRCMSNNSLFRATLECVGAKRTLKIMHSLNTLFMRYLFNTDFTLSMKDI